MKKEDFDFAELIIGRINAFATEYPQRKVVKTYPTGNNRSQAYLVERIKVDSSDSKYLYVSRRYHTDRYVRLDLTAFEDKDEKILCSFNGGRNNIPSEAIWFVLGFCGLGEYGSWGGAFGGATLFGIQGNKDITLHFGKTADLLYKLGELSSEDESQNLRRRKFD
jgi:hypothetical protein